MRKLLLSTTALLALWGCSGDGGTNSSVPATVTLTPPTQFDALGATQKVRVSVLDQKGRVISTPTATWVSSSGNVTVTSLGADSAMLTAVANGSATITATVGGVTGQMTVPVQQVPTTLERVGGDEQVGIPGGALAQPIRAKLMDRLGNGVPGQTLTFAVTTGGGALSSTTAVTAADGTAAVNWTLGPGTGGQTVTVTFGAVPAKVFGATAIATSIGTVLPLRGGNEAAMVGGTAPTAPAVRVVNAVGNPLPGVQVAFTVTDATGSVTGANAVTDANGVAAVGSWTVTAPGPAHLTATVNGTGYNNNPVVFTDYGCQGGGGAGYGITLCYTSTMTATQRAAFVNAATRWGGLITADLPDEPADFPANDCGDDTPRLKLNIDDLVIFAAVSDIDGPGAILGQAGPCYIRDAAPQLTILGVMQFDAADVANLESHDQLQSVILHEMGHVLGIGTLWNFMGFLQNPSPTSGTGLDTYFSGTNGIAGFDAIGGTTYTGGAKVPVENTGGGGTVNSHWREAVLKNELMTGYLNAGTNPLSQLTVRSLQDLGYGVNAAGADPFNLVLSLRATVSGQSSSLDLGDDLYHGPRYTIDRRGVRKRLPSQ
ncbi:MAG TPA: leishmanolysin-related zinc metalloendopeptidase [Longimicrobium sp.]|nr:leishmanolysin-related zinc metalloendopeptidase [Longimicrobium sp.]